MSAAAPIVVVARWRMAADAVAGVLTRVEVLRERTLLEPGCQGYEVFRSVEAPGQLLLIERYADEAAIEAHRRSDHYQDLAVRQIIPLLLDRQVELLQPRVVE